MGLKDTLYKTASRYEPIQRVLRNAVVARKLRFPEVISIESSSFCNADCIMCPRELLSRKKGNMSMDLYRKIIDECAENARYIKLIQPFMFGESFINRQLVDMIAYTKSRLPRVPVSVSTNGSLINPQKAQELIDCKLDKINIDIDGATADTFEAVRVGLDYEQVVENARYLMELKRSTGSRTPEITVTIINMEETQHEVDAFRELWTPIADNVVVQSYTTWTGSVDDKNVGDQAAASATGGFTFPCKHPWEEFVIANDGRVSICCLDFDFKVEVGDVSRQTIREVWNGAPIQEIRQKMIENRYDELEICSQCNNYIFQTECAWHQVWK